MILPRQISHCLLCKQDMIKHGSLSYGLLVQIILPTSNHKDARSPQVLMTMSQPCASHLVRRQVGSNAFPSKNPGPSSPQSPTFGMFRATLQSPITIADIPNFHVLTLIFCPLRTVIYHPIARSLTHPKIAGARSVVHWLDQKPCRPIH